MSQKYIVLTDVEGEIKILSLTANHASDEELPRLCRRMVEKLYHGRRVGELVVQPWPSVN